MLINISFPGFSCETLINMYFLDGKIYMQRPDVWHYMARFHEI